MSPLAHTEIEAADHSGLPVNHTQLGSGIDVSHRTGRRYAGLSERMFPVSTQPPWNTSAIGHITNTVKLRFPDTAPLPATRGLAFETVRKNRDPVGARPESLVFPEVVRRLTGTDMHPAAHHFPDRETREVALVPKRDDGMVVGIEVKTSATFRTSNLIVLRTPAGACGDPFAFSAVLYDGGDAVPFGDRPAAMPVPILLA